MRTLKKTLALVLVVAMMLSFGVIGANAAFTDTSKVNENYAEAVDVLTGIKVIDGVKQADGTYAFDPTGTLTREQAAKIIAYMLLGPTNAELISKATSQKFSDVETTRWSAGYIEYCANVGIILGMGDGTFAPTAKLTTAAFTKMLLCALGYKADVEIFTGDSWAINVASTAITAGVYNKNITISAVTEITREQACQLAFKALTAKTVQYTGGSSMTVNGITITTGATRSYIANETNSGYKDSGNDAFMQFCESHFSALKLYSVSHDAYGRPGHKWMKSATSTIGTYTISPILTYTTAVKPTAVKLAVDNAEYGVAASVVLWTNGVEATYTASTTPTVSKFFASTTPVGGNGCLIEVFDANDDGDVDTLVAVNTWLAPVTGFTTDTAATTAVDERTLTLTVNGHAVTSNVYTPGFEAAYAAYIAAAKAGTACALLVVPTKDGTADGVAKMLAVPETKTLTATSYTATSFVGSDGATYKYSKQYAGTTTPSFTVPFVIALDKYGYVIGSTSVAATANYAYVIRTGSTSDGWNGVAGYKAELLYTDGTTAIVNTAADYSSTTLGSSNDQNLAGEIVTYSVNSAGKTVLVPASASTKINASAFAIKTGAATFTWNSSTANKANASTVLLVGTTNTVTGAITYKAYTGIANFPNLTAASKAGAAYFNATTGVATVIVVVDPTTTGVVTTDKIFVSHVGTATVSYPNAAGGTSSYYVAEAVVNGEIKTIKLASDYAIGVYTAITYDTNNIATLDGLMNTNNSTTANGNAFSSKAITGAVNGVITIDSTPYGYTADCVVYFYDATTGALTASSVAGISAATTSGYVVTNVNGVITALYIQK